MKKIRKIIGNKKGIDTILAALLMVVIVVVASVMVYAWSTGLLGALMVRPQVGQEGLNLENSAFNTNNKNVTLYVRNSGTAAISFASYYVKNATGSTYSRLTWTTAPTIQPNALGTLVIGINDQCGCGSASAGAFTFVSGNSYTVTLVTSRNNQFNFNVVR